MVRGFNIGEKQIGEGKPVYVIAEIGSNHDQDIEKAKELIDVAVSAGADAAKFQSLRFDKVHLPARSGSDVADLYQQINLSESWYQPLAEYCNTHGIHFLSAPTYIEAIPLLLEVGVPAIKIASAQFDIYARLVSTAAQSGLPLIMSVGLTDMAGIERMVGLVRECGNDKFVLMHCITEYPAPLERANLRMVPAYREHFSCLTGYSDHTLGVTAAPAAVALGAVVIEKHITLDRNGDGPDHHFAATPDQLVEMIKLIREVEVMRGTGKKAPLTQSETKQREAFLYKWVAPENLERGTPIEIENLLLRRLDGGIPEQEGKKIQGAVLANDVSEGTALEWSDISLGE